MITKEQALSLKVGDIVHGNLKGPRGCEEWTVSSLNTFSDERWLVQLKRDAYTHAGICEGREGEWHLPKDCTKTITLVTQAKATEVDARVAEIKDLLPGTWTIRVDP